LYVFEDQIKESKRSRFETIKKEVEDTSPKTNEVSAQEQSWAQQKSRGMNLDMWQRYNDCIMCDSKSIPNSQSVLVHHATRNLIVGFNKSLLVWRYEKTLE